MRSTLPHIVYILTKLELGGAQKICLTLAHAMTSEPNSATLISGPEGILLNEALQLKNTILLKSLKREISVVSLWQEIVTFISLIKILRKLKKQYDKIIVHTHSTKAGIIGRWAAYLAGIPTIVHTVHGYGFHEYQQGLTWLLIYTAEWLTQWITTHFIFVSEHDKKTGARLLKQTRKKNSIIRAAVDWQSFFHLNTKTITHKIIIGSIACFKPQKNCLELLQAIGSIIKKLSPTYDIHLELIGDGIQRPQLEAWIKKENLSNNIHLLGWQNNVARYMQHWHLFALSSLWEGLPCAIIEARLSQLPVVAYAVGGIPEVITNNHNGFLINPHDWQTLAEKIEFLILNPNAYKSMAQAQDNLDNFKNEIMIDKHKTLYLQLIPH